MHIVFDDLSVEGDQRPFVPDKAAGTFSLNGKTIELILPIPTPVGNEPGSETYRRELIKVRDALSAMIADPHGIRV